jgi:hypothetical protein
VGKKIQSLTDEKENKTAETPNCVTEVTWKMACHRNG